VAVELFLSDDPERVRELAARLDQLNADRRNTDAGIYREILDLCERDPVTDEHMVLVFSAPGWNRGVIGIVAGRLAEQFHRPVFVLSEDPETGEAHGSARSAGVLHMVEALESMPDLFLRFGGHSHAAGLSLPTVKIAEFRGRINSYAAGKLTPEDLRPRLDIDAVVDLAELTPRAVAELAAMEPFGHRNPPPLLAAMGLQTVSPADVFAEKHLKLRVRRNGQTLLLKGWGMAERAGEIGASACVDVAFAFSDGEATLRDFRRSS
jgi:single-stranded-DNA-specific exonuclease